MMSTPSSFPLEAIPDIEAAPEDYRLLQRIPITRSGTSFPIELNPPVGDERLFVVVDVETTGLNPSADKIIELGLVRGTFSPSEERITSILEAHSRFEDPGIPIPKLITDITGITDQDVAGKHIDDAWLAMMIQGDPLLIAHNAEFDRQFMDSRFPACEKQIWACTLTEVDWKKLGYEGRKLEYLLSKHGYFYQGHRAAVDCLATAWLMHCQPEAFPLLLASARQKTFVVRAFGAPFDVKDTLKSRGYRWHGGDQANNKCWWTVVTETNLQAEQEFLNKAYPNGAQLAQYQPQTARTRFKGENM
ncbi:3'-5' exonuclease [Vreelandella titanicae]|uniref:3'-5' exonuclease n=1 Tax=Vreelandella titanicae TaxID=664683 RepID=UPI0011445D2B|nr:3'-5' exonuclease [Halomonas titanicae]